MYIRDGTIIRKIGTMNPTATEMNFIISEPKPIAINAGIRLIIALVNILSVSDGSSVLIYLFLFNNSWLF